MSNNWHSPWGPSEKYAYREGILKGRKLERDENILALDRANFREAATMLATGEVPLHSPTALEAEVKNLRERVELLEARQEPDPIEVIRAEFKKINERHGIEGDKLGGFVFGALVAAGLVKDEWKRTVIRPGWEV